MFALRTITSATLTADYFVHVTNRGTTTLTHCHRGFVALLAVILFSPD
jgi:hypothetical protein